MVDLAGTGQLLAGAASVASAVMAARAARHAKNAHRAATGIMTDLARHYARVEATYEASREATMSLLAYLQGERAGTEQAETKRKGRK